ncbi:hypothetical protein Ahy_B01g053845 [Arachis hypogaea]|uniref:ABC transmembrane type-1 domain-containing protein n=1 Tax=Arachis hypogaea TaxID=3818 RepID=A0A445ASQ6_ARAHY|nr:hypothetical protein Ahy_B01g053845 [Arachis hypogaea]
MKDGKITQCGKYADLLNNGTDFMELVDFPISQGGKKEEEKKDEQNDKTGNKGDEAKGQLVQEEERESGRVGFSVYWQYITMAYGGALVPFIPLAHSLVLSSKFSKLEATIGWLGQHLSHKMLSHLFLEQLL